MLVGVVAAALTDWRKSGATAQRFFEGVGYAFINIVSIIISAVCFGAGVQASGLAAALGRAIAAAPGVLLPSAAGLPLGFAWVCGSGMASTQSLFGFFVEPALSTGQDPLRVGAIVSLAAAAGRTMSPVAAVVFMSASLTGTEPLALIRRVVLPLLAGITAVVVAGLVLA
jgi:DcuC family C4-dicarboxylate transporter